MSRIAHPLFHTGEAKRPTSPKQLNIYATTWTIATELNALWHSRLPQIKATSGVKSTAVCFVAEYEGLFYASAIWTNPVAAALPPRTWLELRRFAISFDAPRNTGSRMLSVMAKLIQDALEHVEVLVSYQDTSVHSGTIYAAAGWTATRLSREGDDWTGRAGRKRGEAVTTAAKQRWEKRIRTPVEQVVKSQKACNPSIPGM